MRDLQISLKLTPPDNWESDSNAYNAAIAEDLSRDAAISSSPNNIIENLDNDASDSIIDDASTQSAKSTTEDSINLTANSIDVEKTADARAFEDNRTMNIVIEGHVSNDNPKDQNITSAAQSDEKEIQSKHKRRKTTTSYICDLCQLSVTVSL